MAYTDPDVVSDEVTLAEQFLDSLADQIPGWNPRDGQIEPPFAEAVSVIAAATNQLLKDQARLDYADWGKTVLGLPAIAASPAVSLVTVTMDDDAGHTLPAGAQLVATLPSGDTAVFVTLIDVVVAPGDTAVTGISVAADVPGETANGASGVAQLQDPYEFIDSITFITPAVGGVDEEDPDAYTDRLSDRARRQLIIPLTVGDMAAFALDIAGVSRCLAINLLDPAFPDDVSEGHVTLTPLDENGGDVIPEIAVAVVTHVSGDDDRLLNVVVHTEPSTETDVEVTFSATVDAGTDGPTVIAAGEAAVTAYLSRAQWGFDPDAGGKWRATNTVYYLEVAQAIQDVEGIALVTALEVNGDREDVPLAGVAALPNLTSVEGTLA